MLPQLLLRQAVELPGLGARPRLDGDADLVELVFGLPVAHVRVDEHLHQRMVSPSCRLPLDRRRPRRSLLPVRRLVHEDLRRPLVELLPSTVIDAYWRTRDAKNNSSVALASPGDLSNQ